MSEALRLLQERDDVLRMRYEALKRDIDTGITAAEQGEIVSGEDALDRLRKRNREAASRSG